MRLTEKGFAPIALSHLNDQTLIYNSQHNT